MNGEIPELPSGYVVLPTDYEKELRANETELGIFSLTEEIEEFSTMRLLAELRKFCRNKAGTPIPIELHIMSPGGDIYHALAIYDALRAIEKTGRVVTAIVEGCAASAAAMIVMQAASRRLSYENARFLIHEARRWVFMSMEKTSDVEDEHRELQALHKIVFGILAKTTGKSREELDKLVLRKEVWLSAKEALEWGLIDEII